MREIFDLQWRLNIHTLANIGKDFATTIADPEQKLVWIENYRKALSAELAELIREVREGGIGTRNGKIEIIDMLHFLVSLSHIIGIRPDETPAFNLPPNGAAFDGCAIKAFLALDELQNSLKWKWWATGGGFKEERATAALLELWDCCAAFCSLFGMDFETMKKTYIAKNRLNFQRQDGEYDEDNKTEEDNLALKF